jgi:hypothetical protein
MFMKSSPVGAFFVGFSAEKREGPCDGAARGEDVSGVANNLEAGTGKIETSLCSAQLSGAKKSFFFPLRSNLVPVWQDFLHSGQKWKMGQAFPEGPLLVF